jgi:hypothetical protein
MFPLISNKWRQVINQLSPKSCVGMVASIPTREIIFHTNGMYKELKKNAQKRGKGVPLILMFAGFFGKNKGGTKI